MNFFILLFLLTFFLYFVHFFPHRRGGAGSGDDEDQDWKYDFDAPDVADLVKDHKPNFVKAPKRCFEKTDGYYSDQEEGNDDAGESEEPQSATEAKDDGGQSNSLKMEGGNNSQEDEEADKSMGTDENLSQSDANKEVESFKKVTRAEWSKMTYKEKKKYLKERRMWKNRNTVFIKDDSDNEQLTDDEKEEDLHFSDVSEDEKEKVCIKCIKSYLSNLPPSGRAAGNRGLEVVC